MNTSLQHYHTLHTQTLQGQMWHHKRGMRDYPQLSGSVALLLKKARPIGPRLIDATGSGGAVALAGHHEAKHVTILETSHAARRCAEASAVGQPHVTVQAGVIWEARASTAESVILIPSTDKGNARVAAELKGGYHALTVGGELLTVMHKDRGAKRYERWLGEMFGRVDVVAKQGGWRLSRVVKTSLAWPVSSTPELTSPEVAPVPFTAGDKSLNAWPGVFASGKVDRGTQLLLSTCDLGAFKGQRVLDVGCGYGMIGLTAALAGATVTAVDDDLLAVQSARNNAAHLGLALDIRHSDVNAALDPDTRFDAVLMNPPFHVGKQVILEVPRAFLQAAEVHLRTRGVLVVVANKALPYEQEIAPWAAEVTVVQTEQFKVITAYKR